MQQFITEVNETQKRYIKTTLMALAIGIGINFVLLSLLRHTEQVVTYTADEVLQMLAEESYNSRTEAYNEGYKQGMLYAYDNVYLCEADPNKEGLALSWIVYLETAGNPNPVSSITCTE